MNATKQQKQIIELAKTGVSFGIDAGAGCGKTSTAKMIVHALPASRRVFVCSFSNAIVKSLQSAMMGIPNCTVSTVHSCGNRLIGRSHVDGKKIERLAQSLALQTGSASLKYQSSHYQGLIGRARDRLVPYITEDDVLSYQIAQSMRKIFSWKDGRQRVADFCNQLLERSRLEADNGVIDFHDMLEVPIRLFGGSAVYDTVIVDEFQDSNPLQIAFLRSLNANQYIVSYDPLQRLYGFAGAVDDCFQEAETHLGVTETLPLTISFRCSREIARAANKVKTGFTAFTENPIGNVVVSDTFPIQGTGAILARTNKEVLRRFMTLVKGGVRCRISKIETVLTKTTEIMAECDGKGISIARWIESEDTRLLKGVSDLDTRKRICEKIREEAELAEFIASSFPSNRFSGSIENALKFFSANNTAVGDAIEIVTIHASKGLEWENVVVIDYESMDSANDSACLYYVAVTRAKGSVTIMKAIKDGQPVCGLIEYIYSEK